MLSPENFLFVNEGYKSKIEQIGELHSAKEANVS